MGGPFHGGAGDAGDLDGREQGPQSASRKSSFSMFGSLRAASKVRPSCPALPMKDSTGSACMLFAVHPPRLSPESPA